MRHPHVGNWTFGLILAMILLALFIANLFIGSIHIPVKEVLAILTGDETTKESWRYIVLQSRLPQAFTALLCGASLATSGLLLQTAFNNPLAGPSILGISTGASLGVALVMLLGGGVLSQTLFPFEGFLAVLAGAFIGSVIVMSLILFFSTLIKSNLMLLIIGILIGYITSSVISFLNFFASSTDVQAFMVWGLGNFGGISMEQLPYFAGTCIIGLLISLLLIKPLNALLLGTRYAENLGINITRVRNLLLLTTGLLTATTTAFCGPIAFIGLAVPHITRLLLGTSNHNRLLPINMLCGAIIALLCNLICLLPQEAGILPLNAVTPLIGAPIILYVIINQRRIQYFN